MSCTAPRRISDSAAAWPLYGTAATRSIEADALAGAPAHALMGRAGLATARYRSDHLCLAMPLGHRWARRKRIAFAEALDDVVVSVAPGGMMDVLLRREAARLGRVPAWRIQVSGMDAAARMVAGAEHQDVALAELLVARDSVAHHVVT